jgi:ribonuclease P protein component
VQRLKTRAQFEAAMAGGTVSRTAHFVLHRASFPPDTVIPAEAGTEGARNKVLFGVQDQPWIGAVVPKRWAKRAVTRNGIKRQIYALSAAFEARLPAAAHVVRLRSEFARAQFPSAWSDALKASVREELVQLLERGALAVIPAPPVIPAKAGTQGIQE